MLYRVVKPLLFRLESEHAHELVTGMLAASAGHLPALARAAAWFASSDPILASQCFGLRFGNPVGLAAGFDKGASLLQAMRTLGFGHIEVGTVTPRPQPGNPRPRMFRLPEDDALINRMGFNSPGMLVVARRLRAARQAGMGDLVGGVNIGKNRDTPLENATSVYRAALLALAPYADYVAVNISSPNTPGLRRLHERSALEAVLGTLVEANRALPKARPILLKVSPDEDEPQLAEVVDVGMAQGVDGVIATNTTLDRRGLRSIHSGEMGGLSGRPLRQRAQERLALLHRLTDGRMPLIGVGGMFDADDAYARIRAGAALVQVYTGLIYRGPGMVYAINRGLAARLRRDGFKSLSDAVGAG